MLGRCLGKVPNNANEDCIARRFMIFEKLEFMASTKDASEPPVLHPSSITIFIGPNNGGKSTALRELHAGIAHSDMTSNKIFSKIEIDIGDDNDLKEKTSVLTSKDPNNIGFYSIGRRQNNTSIQKSTIDGIMQAPRMAQYAFVIRSIVLPNFVINLSGENRLSLASPFAGETLTDRPRSTIGTIFQDDCLRQKLSQLIHEAFGKYLVINPTNLGQLAYHLSERRPDLGVERSLSRDAIDFFQNSEPVHESSDGTKAFVGIMAEVLAGSNDILFIDEPEAFLHPSLSYTLGREVAKSISVGKQLFAATHSPSFLMGCLSSGMNVNVVRIARTSTGPTVNILDQKSLSEMMTDPLLRSTSVVQGLFHDNVIVVEGDSDRAFYEECNSRLREIGRGIKNPLFLSSHNKQVSPIIVKALRNAGVVAASILDIDWIKEDGTIQARYFYGFGVPAYSRHSMGLMRGEVRKGLEAASKNYKRDGGINCLEEERRQSARDFFEFMTRYGVFTVLNGELESWLSRSGVSRNKQGWLERIFAEMGDTRQPTLFGTPDDTDVWQFLDSLGLWFRDSLRKN